MKENFVRMFISGTALTIYTIAIINNNIKVHCQITAMLYNLC